MYFALDAEQRQLQHSVRRFAEAHSSETDVRVAMAATDGVDLPTWKRLAVDVGVVTLGSGELPGGRGGDLVDTAAVLEVLGEHLYPGPYLSSVLATHVLAATAPGDPVRDLVVELAAGSGLTCAVWPRDERDETEVADGPDGPVLTGALATVLFGGQADQLLVSAGRAWYQVAADAPGVERSEVPPFDQTRRLANLQFSSAPARRIELTAPGEEVLARLRILERIAVSAESIGVARHCLDAGVEYARHREQFGRPIGSFQALQHWFADITLAVECAWAAVYESAWDFAYRPERADRSSCLAAATALEASLSAAEQLLQVHGGVGFTWDNPAHLYLKRAKSDRLLWGHPDDHRRRLGDLLHL